MAFNTRINKSDEYGSLGTVGTSEDQSSDFIILKFMVLKNVIFRLLNNLKLLFPSSETHT